MHKRLYHIGFIGYAILFVLSIVFYKERTIFTDIAYHLFRIVCLDDFAIQHHRFGGVVTQIFPVLGNKLGLSLNNLLLIYSSGTLCYYVLCYVVCGTFLKQYKLALTLLLFNTLLVSDTFFWMISELPQGTAFLFVTFAVINTKTSRYFLPPIKYIVVTLLLIVVAFFHPLLLFPTLFLFLFAFLSPNNNTPKATYFAFLFIYLCAYFVKFQFFKTPYDSAATTNINSTLLNLTHFFDLYATGVFLQDCIGKFFWLPICFVIIIFYYIRTHNWRKLLAYTTFVLGYIVLINTSYHYTSTTSFYMENLYLPLSVFTAVPLVFDIAPSLAFRANAVILSVIILTSIARISYDGVNTYNKRLQWERAYLKEHGHQKLIVQEQQIHLNNLQITWATCFEFWLLSTVETGSTASILIHTDISDKIPPAGKTKSFIAPGSGWPYHMLPKQYFIFKDTVSEYKVIR